jgi:predicted outer membrane repeat protein
MKIFYHYLNSFQKLVLLTLFMLYLHGGFVQATVYTVTNTTDGNGLTQLRGALVAAGSTAGTHTINISAGTFFLNSEISFATVSDVDITITGAGVGVTIIDAKGLNRGFLINTSAYLANVKVAFNDMTIRKCKSSDETGGGGVSTLGGLDNALSFTNCSFLNNTAYHEELPAGGGAIYCRDASLSVTNCTFIDNSSTAGDGGAINSSFFTEAGGLVSGKLNIKNSRFASNNVFSNMAGGGAVNIDIYGDAGTYAVSITESSFTSNSATWGFAGAVRIYNSLELAKVNVHYNRFFGNIGKPGSPLPSTFDIQYYRELTVKDFSGENNWWGCNDGANGCADKATFELLDKFTPHLQLKTTLASPSICAGSSVLVSTGFTSNSANELIDPANLVALIGRPATLFTSPTMGSLSGIQTSIQANGLATALFTSNGTPGTASIFGVLDGNSVISGPLTINAPGTWLGTSSADWDLPANWCGGAVPTASTNIVIPAGTPFAPVISSSSATVNDILIETGASLSLAEGATFDVKGNVTNNGLFSADAAFSFVSFSGASDQTIPGGTYETLSISGGANKILSGNATVNAVMMFFHSSKLALGNNTLTLGAVAEIFDANASHHFVTNGSGGLKKKNIGIQEFTFPIGTETSYTPVVLSNSGTVDDFTARVGDGIYASYVNDVPQGSPVDSKVVNKTWYISENVPGESNVKLSLYWNSTDELPSFGGGCYVSHYGTNGWDSIIYGPANGSNPFFKSRSGITSFSPFGVISPTSSLPVTLSRFDAVREGGTALLSWSTTGETNSDRFEIERSTNGKIWQNIGSVQSNGESKALIAYRFIDVYPLPSQENLYRLRMVDRDETFAYSQIRSLKFDGLDNPVTYPNPVSDQLFVRDFNQVSSLQIIEMSGKVVYQTSKIGNAGIQVSKLSAGLHLVEIKWLDGRTTVQKVVVK